MKPQKTNRWPLFLIIGALSCNNKESPVQQGPEQYSFTKAELSDITGHREYPALLEGIQNIEIRPRLDGFIQEIYVDEGQQVKKGDLLFKLEVESLEEQANASRSAIKVAEAQVNAAQIEVDKLAPLVTDSIISEIQLETAKANLAAAESQFIQAQSNYKSAQRNVSYQNVISPVNGIVGRINYRKGSLVGRSEPLPLTSISNISQVYAYFSMNEKDFFEFLDETPGEGLNEKLKSFPKVELILANGSVYQSRGTIQTTTGQIDPETGAISFRAIFPNPEQYLNTGNSGLIKIPVQYKDALLIPSASTFEIQGMRHIYTLKPDSTLSSNSINTAAIFNNVVVVESGLEPGEMVLAEGIGSVRAGLKVLPQLQPMDSMLQRFDQVFN